ncbi:unnamed protein product [Allacma fusca]|uniref:Uncharacterized protein n=1 Tax=Allacma fusca TaxID=39272 RepID=A0A8J2NXE4_9HEXA|nr:unnamed protein product [Allacma fusca]
MELLIRLVNYGYAPAVYTLKMSLMIVAIVTGCFGFMHFSANPSLAVFLLVMWWYCMVIYGAAFGRAYCLQENMEVIKSELVRHTQIMGTQGLYARLIKKRIKSIANVGLKVGEFHTMERESTPIFIDHVVKTVVSTLMVFRR